MNDKPLIAVGLTILLGGLSFPVWHALSACRSAEPPALELPSGRLRCVEDARYMRAHHMDLLREWRDAVVRQGHTSYVSKASGQRYERSLTRTCLGCHTSQRTFCSQCHGYVNVRPSLDCWSCHVDPKGGMTDG